MSAVWNLLELNAGQQVLKVKGWGVGEVCQVVEVRMPPDSPWLVHLHEPISDPWIITYTFAEFEEAFAPYTPDNVRGLAKALLSGHVEWTTTCQVGGGGP